MYVYRSRVTAFHLMLLNASNNHRLINPYRKSCFKNFRATIQCTRMYIVFRCIYHLNCEELSQ